MNYQITTLSQWGRFLYQAGLKSKHIAAHGTPKELRELHEACLNAELLLKMQEESKRLFDAVSDQPITSRKWREFTRLKGKMYPTLQRFIHDANLYDWPALVTAFIPTSMPAVPDTPDMRNIPTSEELIREVEHGGKQ